jgi:hypothetical protein
MELCVELHPASKNITNSKKTSFFIFFPPFLNLPPIAQQINKVVVNDYIKHNSSKDNKKITRSKKKRFFSYKCRKVEILCKTHHLTSIALPSPFALISGHPFGWRRTAAAFHFYAKNTLKYAALFADHNSYPG